MPDYAKEATELSEQFTCFKDQSLDYEEANTLIATALASAYERGKEESYALGYRNGTSAGRIEGAKLCAKAVEAEKVEHVCKCQESSNMLAAARSVVTDLEKGKPVMTKKELPEGACDACWGKGKYTVFAGEVGYDDFGGDGFYSPPRIQTHDCSKCGGTGKKPVVEGVCGTCKRRCHQFAHRGNAIIGYHLCSCASCENLNTSGHSEPPRCERCKKEKCNSPEGCMCISDCCRCQPTKGEV